MDNNQTQPKSMATIRSEFEAALPSGASRELQRDFMGEDEYSDPLVQFAFNLWGHCEIVNLGAQQSRTSRIDNAAMHIMAALYGCPSDKALNLFPAEAAEIAYCDARALAAERDK